jgi:hypothetical protein
MVTRSDVRACAAALSTREEILEYICAALETDDRQAIAFAFCVAADAVGVNATLRLVIDIEDGGP